jgi:hypothetical protein
LPAYLTVDSTNASVKIYGIRVYRKSLTSKEIINNYTASLPSQEEKEKVFKATNVYNS